MPVWSVPVHPGVHANRTPGFLLRTSAARETEWPPRLSDGCARLCQAASAALRVSDERLATRIPDRAIGMAVGHAGRPDPETVRRSVPSAWPGQLGWECRLEWPNTTVHIHLSLPSRDWRLGYPIGLSGWPSDMPAGRPQRLPVVEGPPAGVDVGSLRVRVS